MPLYVRVAIVSDTHGQVDPRLKKLFRSASVLVHGGDVNDLDTYLTLERMIPGATLVGVRGNNDSKELVERLPAIATVDVQGIRLLVAHRAEDAEKALAEKGNTRAKVVVCGHSHKPSCEVKDGRLWINPGGAGPKRFKLTRAAAVLEIRKVELVARVYSIEDERLPVIAEARMTSEP